MKTNLTKWAEYLADVERRADIFMEELYPNPPQFFYIPHIDGAVRVCKILRRYYSFRSDTYKAKDNPTKIELARLKSLHDSDIVFDAKNAYFEYRYSWGFHDGVECFASTSIKILDVLNEVNIFLNKEDAERKSVQMKINFDANKKYFEKHKKTPEYDYKANGYNFLGWQNGWAHVHYDEDGNITSGDTSKGEKPKKSFGYDSSKHPEYASCVKEKHQLIEVQHNRRGSENTVSCPICMIYWKYDCSD
jgi:hypothetical protein